MADCTRAIQINQNFRQAYRHSGQIYYVLDGYARALADFTSAIEIDFDVGNAHSLRGQLYLELALSEYSELQRAEFERNAVEDLRYAQALGVNLPNHVREAFLRLEQLMVEGTSTPPPNLISMSPGTPD